MGLHNLYGPDFISHAMHVGFIRSPVLLKNSNKISRLVCTAPNARRDTHAYATDRSIYFHASLAFSSKTAEPFQSKYGEATNQKRVI